MFLALLGHEGAQPRLRHLEKGKALRLGFRQFCRFHAFISVAAVFIHCSHGDHHQQHVNISRPWNFVIVVFVPFTTQREPSVPASGR